VFEDLMRAAIERAALEFPHPNPRVGATLVDEDGHVLGVGAHVEPGTSHAEVLALAEAGEHAGGATLIVTLEPCDHHGRTPPCTDAIIAAGIRRVVVGAVDPDRRVAGAGVDRLRAAGIEVVEGVLSDLVEESDPAYFHHRRTGKARITVKAAMTLDGQTAASDGSSQWVTNVEAREDAHRLRAASDAVVVGAGTIRLDDPRLDVRLPEYTGHQPRPVIIAGQRPLPPGARILERNPLVYLPRPIGLVEDEVVLPDDTGGAVDLPKVVVDLAERGYLEVMVEGGARLAGALWESNLIDRGVFYLGSMVAGGVGTGVFDRVFLEMAKGRPVEITSVDRLGPDLRVEWRFES
jgi:diaminohydroxyphosphoribosylaminopyrimidine deaminase / 5-amino-6-(5-phosphoribosylamino)uracil reductase